MEEKKIVVGFWLRVLSDILDAIFLFLFGLLLAIPFHGLFYAMGENGLWFGLIVTFLYTGILQSSIGGGQSLAKIILKIQVLSIDGSYLSLTRSFIRYSILALVIYHTWIGQAFINLIPALDNRLVSTIYFVLISTAFLGTCILMALHPLKRGLQDLIVGSVVVRKGMYDRQKIDELNNRSKIKRAYIVWGISAVLIVGAFFCLTHMVTNSKTFQPLVAEMSDLSTEMSYLSKEIPKNTHFKFEGIAKQDKGEGNVGISVTVFLNKKKFDDKAVLLSEVQKAVNLLIESYPKTSECNWVNIQVRTGFDIGLCHLTMTQNHLYTPDGKPIER